MGGRGGGRDIIWARKDLADDVGGQNDILTRRARNESTDPCSQYQHITLYRWGMDYQMCVAHTKQIPRTTG